MPSLYLQPGEYATYGVTGGEPLIVQASTLIDAFLKRPEGLIWTPDATGQPCFMAALEPTLQLTSSGSIAPGANVAAVVTGPVAMIQIGDVLILDRANPAVMEAVTVNAISPGVSIGLRSVVNAHSPGALLEAGLVITEQKFMPNNRPLTLLARTPVVRIVAGSGRYGYGRRGDNGASSINDFNLLAAFSKFGGPPVWEIFDPASSDVDPNTGQLWIPAGIMLAYYTEVKIRYLAGFPASALPSQIKFATGRLVRALANNPQYGSVRSYRTTDTTVQRFADTLIEGDVRDALLPFRTNLLA